MQEFETERERQIVGIVADIRDGGLNNDPEPTMYVPQAQVPDAVNALNAGITPMAWIVSTEGNPYALVSAPSARRSARRRGCPISEIRTMDQVIERSMSRQRFNMWLMTVFGGAALLLAAIGIYGLDRVLGRAAQPGDWDPARARREPGARCARWWSRRACGWSPRASCSASRRRPRSPVIASLLFGVTPWDPSVLVGAPFLLAAVALVATWIPARRASRVEPIRALRVD